MMEVWKPIPAFEGHYEVSNFGRVRSVDRTIEYVDGRKPRFFSGGVKPPYKKDNGYLSVTLYKNRRGTTRYIHRLVLLAFADTKNTDTLEVNHKDGDKGNNRLDNLEWVSSSENKIHAVNTGLHKSIRKLTDEDIQYIRNNPNNLMQKELAKMFGVTRGHISMIRTGKKR